MPIYISVIHHFRECLSSLLIIVAITLSLNSVSGQVTRTWNASANSNWNSAPNWTPNGVPTSADIVIFDNTSDFDCQIDINVTIDSISVENGYDGIITQNAGFSLQVNNGASFEGGTFNGGDQTITILESFTINGTDFTSTSATLNFLEGSDNSRHDISLSAGIFNHNGGLVRFSITSGSTGVYGDFIFYDLFLNGRYRTLDIFNNVQVQNDITINNTNGSIEVDLHDTLTVLGNLAYTGSSSQSIDIDNGDSDIGTLKFEGSTIDLLSGSIGGGGSASLYISGTGTQIINAPSTSGFCPLPDTKIACNELEVNGHITLNSGIWEYLSGTLNHPDPFEIVLNGTSEITGNAHTLDSLTINGNFTTTSISAALTIEGDFDIIPSNITNIDIDAPFVLNNDMNINASSDVFFNISSNQKSMINGNLSTVGTEDIQINNDTLAIAGNIDISHSGTGGGGTGVLELNGTSQLITIDTGLDVGEGLFPSLYINLTGTLSFANSGVFNLAGSWQYEQGILDLTGVTIAINAINNSAVHSLIAGNPHTLNSLYFIGSFGFLDITADVSLDGHLSIESNSSSGPAVLTLSQGLLVAGNFTTSGADNITINSDTISIQGDIDIDHTGLGIGTGAIEIIGNGAQLFSGGDALLSGSVPDVVVSKPSGTLTLENIITVFGDWTLEDGIVDTRTNGSTLNMISANPSGLSLDLTSPDGLMTLDTLIVSVNRFGQLNINDDLNVRGDLIIDDGSAINFDSNNIEIGGDWINNNSTNDGVLNLGTVTFIGSQQQNVQCSACIGGESFTDVVVNNTAGGLDDIFLQDSIQITGSLLLTNGVLETDTDAVLFLLDGATTNLGNINSYVNGRVAYERAATGSITLNFPMGKAGSYNPFELTIDHSSATSYTYLAEVFNASANALGFSLPSTITNLSALKYWNIDRMVTGGANSPSTDLSGNAIINLHYQVEDEVDDYENLIIAKYDGVDAWQNLGGVANGNGAGSIVSQSTPTAFNSFNGQLSIGNNINGTNTLPVSLVSYTGAIEDGKVSLQWITSSELNNSHFNIERSIDGITFAHLGRVDGHGTVNEENYYQFIDYSKLQDTQFYRLSQIDFDGTVEALGIINVHSFDNSSSLEILFDKETSRFNFIGLNNNEKIEFIQAYSQKGELIGEYENNLELSTIKNQITFIRVLTNFRQKVFKLSLQ